MFSNISNGFEKKTSWAKRGSNFVVEISHHLAKYHSSDEGPNRWCIYAYISESHPHFKRFDREDSSIFQEAAHELDLHGGPTYLRWYIGLKEAQTSVKVGADYHHDGDEEYTTSDNPEDAWKVFRDADKLFELLDGMKE